MGVESKLVTLADLKAAYDDLKRRAYMWEDITDTLTFVESKWTVLKNGTGSTSIEWVSNNASTNYTRYISDISVSPGERYRIAGWNVLDGTSQRRYIAALLDSNAQVFTAYEPSLGLPDMALTNSSYHPWVFGQVEVVIPKTLSTLRVLSYSNTRGAGNLPNDIIVEKLIQ